MNTSEQAKDVLKSLLASQLQTVLATQDQNQPYTSLMAFVVTEDLKRLFFATYRNTHKYRNLTANPQVALLIDNRTGHMEDHYRSVAVTATGCAREVDPKEIDNWLNLYLAKHPNLKEFVTSLECVGIEVQVEHYYLVNQFQQVVDVVP
jgi:nitroimidazol reductase NimA-like FMN-containing flavoprotein (pyridoxamine 5'-phosphate oxidase superfamily)